MRQTLWILTAVRALGGSVFLWIAFRQVLLSHRDLVLCRIEGINGFAEESLRARIKSGWIITALLFLLTSAAWVTWPIVGYLPVVSVRQIVASAFVTVVLVLTGYMGTVRRTERARLMDLARRTKAKEVAQRSTEGG